MIRLTAYAARAQISVMVECTGSVLYVRALMHLTDAFGIPEDRLLQEAGLDRDVVMDCDARVTKAVIANAWNVARSLSGVDNLGLKAAQLAPPGIFTVLDHLAANQATLGESGRLMVRYYRLCDPELSMRFELTAEGYRVSYAFPSLDVGYSRDWAEALLALLLCRARTLSGHPEIVPANVTFQHRAPPDQADHQMLFRCPIQFGEPFTTMLFPHGLLKLPVKEASPFLSRLIIDHAERQLRLLPDAKRTVDFVKRALIRAMDSGRPLLTRVAREAHCSPRVLQARLKAEGSSFAALVDDMLRSLALQYLSDPSIRTIEVPLLLRYAEPSPFFRAFRRWTGMTPTEYRRAAAMSTGSAEGKSTPSAVQ